MFLCEDWIEISYWVSFVFCLRVLFPSKCSLSSPGPWRHFSNAEGWLEALLLECMLLCLMKLIWLMTGALRGSAGLCPTHCHCSQRGTGCVSSDLLFAVLWACTVLAGAGGRLGVFKCLQRYLSRRIKSLKPDCSSWYNCSWYLCARRIISAWFSRKTILTTKCCLLPP